MREQCVSASAQYDQEYYKHHCGTEYDRSNPLGGRFFGKIADQLIQNLTPKRVLDVGCGKGFLVEALRDRGVEAYGIDVSECAIGEVQPDIRPYCSVAAATDPIQQDFDLITCIEVVERLSEEDGRKAIANICARARAVLFASTPDDFAEPTHLNARPMIHWLRLFREYSFVPDVDFACGFLSPYAVLLRHSEVPATDEWLDEFAWKMAVSVLRDKDRQLAEKDGLLSDKDRILSEKDRLLANKESQLEALRQNLEARDAMLNTVLTSKGWLLLNRYRDLRNKAKRLVFDSGRRVLGRHRPMDTQQYEKWIEHERQLRPSKHAAQERIATFPYQPVISLVMPVYNTRIDFLQTAIASVRGQYYENWELCICDDASDKPHVKPFLEDCAARDPRIKVFFSAQNEGISLASNHALQLATGEYIGLLDHDDELSCDALFEVVSLLQQQPEADVIYSDEDKLEIDGRRCDPFFKPDWSPEYLLSCMYTCHFGVYRRSLMEAVGGFRKGYEGSQDYDLMLRFSEQTRHVCHIPKVLYHWRKSPGSTAAASQAKSYSSDAGRRALDEHLERRGIRGQVINDRPNRYRVRPEIKGTPLISILIPTKDHANLLRKCIQSIEGKTAYSNYEIVIIDNGSSEENACAYLRASRHKVLPYNEPFNFSAINNFGARHATGEYLVFLNDDTEVISPEWLTAMLEFAQFPDIGIVGAKLLYSNGKIQHAGVVLGMGGIAGHPYSNFPGKSSGYFDALFRIRNVSAVTGACMMMRREVFEKVGGFDEQLPVNFNDVDLCLRVRQAGYRIVWTPYATLEHHESATRQLVITAEEVRYVQDRWGGVLLNDPYYNPNLTLQRSDYSLRL
jgi:GT2 family glycosyltransferase/SAM-dependent methyltransferase